jgi:hypothetical protein
MHPGHALSDPAADVIAGEHNVGKAEFLDQTDDAAGLGGGAVEVAHRNLVLVGPAEPT